MVGRREVDTGQSLYLKNEKTGSHSLFLRCGMSGGFSFGFTLRVDVLPNSESCIQIGCDDLREGGLVEIVILN